MNSIFLNGEKTFIKDIIHDSIELTPIAKVIVDTPIFQRLRNLHQLGVCYLIFPNANNNRFEHSIGTYHLTKQLLDTLTRNIGSYTDPCEVDKYLNNIDELKKYYKRTYDDKTHTLDIYIVELIKIAGLCHDLGHGPYSHIFDDVFIPNTGKKSSPYASHEMRSGALLERIIKNDNVLSKIITDDEIMFMKNIINPKAKHSGFVYQIVSNNLNGLDVDKYDYLKRDSVVINIPVSFDFSRLIQGVKIVDNIICYPEQAVYDVLNLYNTRHYLHRQVYGHKGVIASQYIISEIMELIDPILNISSSVENLDNFILLSDEYILNSIKFLNNSKLTIVPHKYKVNLEKATQLMINLGDYHKLYPYIGTVISETKSEMTEVDFAKIFNKKSLNKISSNDILLFKNRVGYVSGNKTNPLDNIYVYKTKHLTKDKLRAIKFDKSHITKLMPALHQEHVMMIFYKYKDNTDAVDELRKFVDSELNSFDRPNKRTRH